MLSHAPCSPMWLRANGAAAASAVSTAVSQRCGSSAVASALPPRVKLPDGPTLEDFLGKGKSSTSASLRPPVVRKPPWLKMKNPDLTTEGTARFKLLKSTVTDLKLATVCQQAKCPNIGECWSEGSATVMIMGDTCTRGCRFCSVATSKAPPALDPDEPAKLAEAVVKWGLDYVVLTMVDRDDIPDQGASHVAATIRELKLRSRDNLLVEALVGDMQGNHDLVAEVARSGMDVFAHNLETVERLTRVVRDRRAGYRQTLAVLAKAKEVRPSLVTKSSIMLGLGESKEEIQQAMHDLRGAGVDILTFGQYLQPTKRHMKVTRFVPPSEFDEWKIVGEALGFEVASGPLVRSSYRAGELFKSRLAKRASPGITVE